MRVSYGAALGAAFASAVQGITVTYQPQDLQNLLTDPTVNSTNIADWSLPIVSLAKTVLNYDQSNFTAFVETYGAASTPVDPSSLLANLTGNVPVIYHYYDSGCTNLSYFGQVLWGDEIYPDIKSYQIVTPGLSAGLNFSFAQIHEYKYLDGNTLTYGTPVGSYTLAVPSSCILLDSDPYNSHPSDANYLLGVHAYSCDGANCASVPPEPSPSDIRS